MVTNCRAYFEQFHQRLHIQLWLLAPDNPPAVQHRVWLVRHSRQQSKCHTQCQTVHLKGNTTGQSREMFRVYELTVIVPDYDDGWRDVDINVRVRRRKIYFKWLLVLHTVIISDVKCEAHLSVTSHGECPTEYCWRDKVTATWETKSDFSWAIS